MIDKRIFEILSSKPHNLHFLKRYVKYLNLCEIKNKDKKFDHTENHHICPKASDLFPEYSSFRIFRWNKIKLTPHQHIWAHIILWKAYGGSQSQAIHFIFNVQHADTNYRSQRRIPSALNIRYAAKIKQEFYKNQKGFSTYKDSEGVKYFLHKDNPSIKELGLVGNNAGLKMTEGAKESMRGPRMIALFYKGTPEKKSVKFNSEDHKSLLVLGWEEERSVESRVLAKENQKKISSEKLTGTASYYYPSGTFYGRIPKDSPIIAQLGLIHIRSEAQKKQASELAASNAKNPETQAKKSARISSLKWCHHPETKQNSRLADVPEGWISGKFGESKVKNTTTWNDGVRNYRVKEGDKPDSSWVAGMAPQKPRKPKSVKR